MFRCVTKLKGLAIDIDSFDEISVSEWKEISQQYRCIFLTDNPQSFSVLAEQFGADSTVHFQRNLAPNLISHTQVLFKSGLKHTEIAYVSCNHAFLVKANTFLSGTIWITDHLSYKEASYAPDHIRYDFSDFKQALKNNVNGFFGEAVLSPEKQFPAMMIPIELDDGSEMDHLYMLGRYYSSNHYMGQLHRYSIAISQNKREGKKYSGEFDSIFGNIFCSAVEYLKQYYNIQGVCAVPVKPNKRNRYKEMLASISKKCSVNNYGEHFICTRNYPDQKPLAAEERRKNIDGVFQFQADLTNKCIVIIDDIMTTGSTLNECAKELKKSGASRVIGVVLGINQLGNYWSSDSPSVRCPICQNAMFMQINIYREFFYYCMSCYKRNQRQTLDYIDGWRNLCDSQNSMFNYYVKEYFGNQKEQSDVLL